MGDGTMMPSNPGAAVSLNSFRFGQFLFSRRLSAADLSLVLLTRHTFSQKSSDQRKRR
jgi:hypothetical protein